MSRPIFEFNESTPLSGVLLQPKSGIAKSVVIFVHGYGADGSDLIGLGQNWQSNLPNTLFIAPNAPDRCATNPQGYEWFPISKLTPQELDFGVLKAAPLFNTFIDYVLEKTDVDAPNTFLVGFSQGTMMSLHVGLRYRDALGGIIGYSGALALPEQLPKQITHRIPVLLVHGDADAVVPVFMLHAAVKSLKKAGVQPSVHVCPGLSHGIDQAGSQIGNRRLEHLVSLKRCDDMKGPEPC